MESFRIPKRDVYTIEVNDAGETIEFDLVDISLPLRLNKAYADVDKALETLKGQIVLFEKEKENSEKSGVLSKAEEKFYKNWEKAFKEMRKAMDGFLGDGGCQKIFGDRNYLEMWNDLYECLEPHIEKMGMKSNDIKQRIKEKYGKKNDGVLR